MLSLRSLWLQRSDRVCGGGVGRGDDDDDGGEEEEEEGARERDVLRKTRGRKGEW